MQDSKKPSERRRLDDSPGQIAAPPPQPEIDDEPSRRSNAWGFFRPVLIVVIAAAIVGGAVYYLYRQVLEKYLQPVEPGSLAGVEVTIPKGSSLSDISEILYENNLIRNKQVFKFYTDFTDNAAKLKAGTYTLAKGMDFDDIIYALRQSTDAAPTAQVTLPEGLTISAFATILSDNGVIDGSGGYQEVCMTGTGVALPEALQDPDLDTSGRACLLEGYLFPDTYEFYTSSEPAEVVRRQLVRFEEIFTDEFKQRAAELHMTQDEVITLASIIEKEAKTDQFAEVSAVFHNRLAEGMPLQSDATISYGLGITNRINLTAEELQAENPYNTHTRTGLPAGPICNPGRAAIEAALYPNPEYTDEGYLYFTLTDPEEGTLAFSRTYDEHEALVEQWRPVWSAWDAEHSAP